MVQGWCDAEVCILRKPGLQHSELRSAIRTSFVPRHRAAQASKPLKHSVIQLLAFVYLLFRTCWPKLCLRAWRAVTADLSPAEHTASVCNPNAGCQAHVHRTLLFLFNVYIFSFTIWM